MLDPTQPPTPDEVGQNELARILGALTSEGQLSSTGVFTIDVRAALPKLEKFQLPAPHFGLLKVIQSGIASGATYIDARFGGSGITIEHDGLAPLPEELRDLLGYLLNTQQGSADRSLRDLAIGVNTALARGGSWVEVSVRDRSDWTSQRWVNRQESSQAEQTSDRGDRATVRFQVRRTLGQAASEVLKWANKDLIGLYFRRREVLDEDASAIYDRCRNAPIEVRLNGRLVPAGALSQKVVRRWRPGRLVEHRKALPLEIIVQAARPSAHLSSAPQSSQARHQFVLYGDFDGRDFRASGVLQPTNSKKLAPKSCFAVIGIRDRGTVPGEIIWIKDGIELTRQTPSDMPKGVSALLSAEGLRLDLSGFRLVDGPEIKERMAWLTRTVRECSSLVLNTFPELYWSESEESHLRQLAQLED